MSDVTYLESILDSQKLEEGSPELEALREHKEEIEGVLRKKFGSSPTIRYGGSRAKGTLIKESYDLDIVNYFARKDTQAGDTLEEIHSSVKTVLEKNYVVEVKNSALRIKSRDQLDFYIDVVPGRFVADDDSYDVHLYRADGDKKYLKTNIETHIAHVKDSGVRDAIKLVKLWRTRHGVPLKTFVLELIVIELLGKSKEPLDRQIRAVLDALAQAPEDIHVEDPANPTGNDLSALWNSDIQSAVSSIAKDSVARIKSSGWEAIYGKLPDKGSRSRVELLGSAARSAASTASRPWCRTRR